MTRDARPNHSVGLLPFAYESEQHDFTLSLADLRYTRFGASGREGALIHDVRHSCRHEGSRKCQKTGNRFTAGG